jgi:hypothetical protein
MWEKLLEGDLTIPLSSIPSLSTQPIPLIILEGGPSTNCIQGLTCQVNQGKMEDIFKKLIWYKK